MKTTIYEITQLNEEALSHIEEAAGILKKGGLVAFPTETVYGLGANALDEVAVSKIYHAKGRPGDNPLIVHIADVASLDRLTTQKEPIIEKLAERFWPGPLTLVLQKKPAVPAMTTGGLNTVAVRIPDHPVALELIRRAGCPVAAPSANLSGKPSPTRGKHVAEDMTGRIPMILSAGDCSVGIESTVVDLSGDEPTILRPGILTAAELAEAIGTPVSLDPSLLLKKAWNAETDGTGGAPAPRSPGMKYTHYAPRAEMLIFSGKQDRIAEEIKIRKEQQEALGKKVGVILFEENEFRRAAGDLFARLREMDEEQVDLILAGALSEENAIGFAVMNRMLKSAGYHVITV